MPDRTADRPAKTHDEPRVVDPIEAEVKELIAGSHTDPHHLLGMHPTGKGSAVIRTYHPEATGASVLHGDQRYEMQRWRDTGVFWVELPAPEVYDYKIEIITIGGHTFDYIDPYRFISVLGELDLHLIAEGRHETLWHNLGAHYKEHELVWGTAFSVWAPNARGVRVIGEFNEWDGRRHPMRLLGGSGIWEIFIPSALPGHKYKYEILTREGQLRLKGDPYAFATERPPATASVIAESHHHWQDDEWMQRRRESDPMKQPMTIYECHIGSWRRKPEESDRALTYRELADELGDYLVDMGFTHVEFLPVSEHPFRGSWGYQVSAYYAPSARFGSPDDFKFLIDSLHQRGIGVIIDWVPAHFPKDDFALARFDGTALYEHADPRQGEHPDWGTLVFNFGRNEVRNFLLANALFWIEEFHVDGLRVDAVASMLYLDYSRKEGEWVPNKFGGRENLEAVQFLKDVNSVVYGRNPGVVTIAEESTAWPGVSRPTYLGGLGFGFKWNLGWMHDTLDYFAKQPIYRRYHHNNLTFGMLYQWHENFILPLSHDEVVHGKGSLVGKMPGDRWQKLANLRALIGWMWSHPGKQLLFMGGELAQEQEWSHDRSLDWHLLDDPAHAGVHHLVRTVNRLMKDECALWERDFDSSGFHWIDANDPDNNVLSFLRFAGSDGSVIACIANLASVPRYGYRVGLPVAGEWNEILNTDHPHFGGSGVLNVGPLTAEPRPWHGLPNSAEVTLPPLGVVWLSKAPSNSPDQARV